MVSYNSFNEDKPWNNFSSIRCIQLLDKSLWSKRLYDQLSFDKSTFLVISCEFVW